MSARILLLGGTGDALKIARALGSHHVYSLAGLGKVPDDLRCDVRVGGFGGAAGLAAYLRDAGIGLVIDATHPYAARISANAAAAAREAGVPLWALRRAPWVPQPGDDWRMVDDWAGIEAALAPFRRSRISTRFRHTSSGSCAASTRIPAMRARRSSPRAGRSRSTASARCSR